MTWERVFITRATEYLDIPKLRVRDTGVKLALVNLHKTTTQFRKEVQELLQIVSDIQKNKAEIIRSPVYSEEYEHATTLLQRNTTLYQNLRKSMESKLTPSLGFAEQLLYGKLKQIALKKRIDQINDYPDSKPTPRDLEIEKLAKEKELSAFPHHGFTEAEMQAYDLPIELLLRLSTMLDSIIELSESAIDGNDPMLPPLTTIVREAIKEL